MSTPSGVPAPAHIPTPPLDPKGSASDVADWLRQLPGDLSKYADVVISKDINASRLYAGDPAVLVVQMEVSSIGHKHTIKKHISQLQIGAAEPDPIRNAAVDHRRLQVPEETKHWLLIKEGFLLKTKIKKMRKSTKLRWFVLRQDPASLAARLEYYEGMTCRGMASLQGATVLPETEGVFLVETPNRTFILQAEGKDITLAMSWVLALQQTILTCTPALRDKRGTLRRTVRKSVVEPPPEALGEGSAAERYRQRNAGEMPEIDGAAIDSARWAALRRSLYHPSEEEETVEEDWEEDEDIIALREAEEAEERRQEEERQAWLAQRAAAAAPGNNAGSSSAPAAGAANTADTTTAAVTAADGSAANDAQVNDAAELSEDDDYDYEEEMRLMRLAEEEEERRQEEERQEMLRSRGLA